MAPRWVITVTCDSPLSLRLVSSTTPTSSTSQLWTANQAATKSPFSNLFRCCLCLRSCSISLSHRVSAAWTHPSAWTALRLVNAVSVRRSVFIIVPVCRAHYFGLQACASLWTCPICAAKISECRRVELQEGMAAAKARGCPCASSPPPFRTAWGTSLAPCWTA